MQIYSARCALYYKYQLEKHNVGLIRQRDEWSVLLREILRVRQDWGLRKGLKHQHAVLLHSTQEAFIRKGQAESKIQYTGRVQ